MRAWVMTICYHCWDTIDLSTLRSTCCILYVKFVSHKVFPWNCMVFLLSTSWALPRCWWMFAYNWGSLRLKWYVCNLSRRCVYLLLYVIFKNSNRYTIKDTNFSVLALRVCTDESFSYSPLMDNLCVQFVEKMCHSWHIKGSPCNLRNADSPCYRLASQLAPIHLIRLDRDIKGCCLLERQAG